ncbi:bifunctional nuclease 2 [Lycium barbarum]|uniref:bifunctional nuclease 2 n=1 Tax=Lycium barbarum TaxID=112863 RepID=UPI00293E35B7|nr:bifunctional nuclease 2 [Lycium barbarum]
MMGAQLRIRPVAGILTDLADTRRWSSSSHCYSPIRNISHHLSSRNRHCRKTRLMVICSKSSRGRFNGKSNQSDERDDDDDYIEAVLLVSETTRHYKMRMHGFQEEPRWHSSAHLAPFSFHPKDRIADASSLGTGFLRRFKNPTIFLKISCDAEYVLPVIVGEHAVKKLIDSLHEEEAEDYPDQFLLLRNLLAKFGYEVKMVRITERVTSTYFARIYFQKPGEKDIINVDARPSDAINVARRCKAPIFVNKQIVLTDATRIGYGMDRSSRIKSTYDVLLDSASDGPDLLSEELSMLRNMNLAANEERYNDAAMWKDKLMRLREKT